MDGEEVRHITDTVLPETYRDCKGLDWHVQCASGGSLVRTKRKHEYSTVLLTFSV